MWKQCDQFFNLALATRRAMDDHLKHFEEKLPEQSQRVANQSKKIDGIMELQLGMKNQMNQIRDTSSENGHNKQGGSFREPNNTENLGYTPKFSFPKFDGSNSRVWIKQCSRYFSLCHIVDEQMLI